MENLDKKYVVVTTVSSYRMRYAIPMDQLQALNTDQPVDPKWALDNVVCEEVNEFSQEWLGEHIIDYTVINEEQIVELFDHDNDYLKEWPRDKKIEHIRNCGIKKQSTLD
jgi:predicted house-cleaning noncanonical NTP pyrophosphatase (MazG superfamily)